MRASASTLQSLEWDRLVLHTRELARSAPGKVRIDRLNDPAAWASTLEDAQGLQEETSEVLSLLGREALWGPLQDLTDPEPSLDRLGRGSVLEVAELAMLRRWLQAVESWTQFPKEEIYGAERFKRALGLLPRPGEPLRVLDRVLTPEGEISERASPKLHTLHQEIRGLKREIHIVLDQLVKTYATRGILQENFTDVRDGRFVVPVKISNQNDIEGIIYEASASRQTVFVEPREVAVLNNRLRQRQNDLQQELFRILEETSRLIQPFAPEIQAAALLLTYWDAVQAKARIGHAYGGRSLQVTRTRGFRLEGTANPLLWWSLKPAEVIRNEIHWGEQPDAEEPARIQPRTLLLTGPNTGGKTVFLKTLGLAGICARTGFPFPASGNPSVPFFDSFFADVGDSQSIERHLSSFSGHILRFKEILDHLSDRSLVLLDELNSATDPEEGAALGRAFLESLMARGAMVVATTHDPHLKALSISDSRILSASMAFDESSRAPTYQMLFGVPGRSRAIETAARLGLPEPVLELARQYLTRDHLEFEGTLRTLERELETASEARREADRLRMEAERLQREWTRRTESQAEELLERTRTKLRRILEQAQEEVRTSVRKLDDLKSRREIDQTRSGISQTFQDASQRIEAALSEEAPEIAETLRAREARPTGAPAPITVGSTVRIPKWKATGQVLELSGKNVKVAMGAIQMNLSLPDIEPLSAAETAQLPRSGAKARSRAEGSSGAYVPPGEIDLRGKRLEDAMSELQGYLDLAYRSGNLSEVVIIHGLGTGAIRENSRKLLKRLPYVKEFRDGGPGRGGTGATVVEFERD